MAAHDYINLEIATLDSPLFSGKVKEIIAPTKMGEIAVLPLHVPMVSALQAGELKLKVNEGEGIYSPDMIYIAISGGFMEVLPESRVNIVADSALRVDEIDEKKAMEAKEKAERLMKDYHEGKEKVSDQAFASAAAEMAKALAQIKVAQRKKRRHS